ncbi:hypothetical protein PILCRDRAFT_798152 [Piloderma croceum F 1598]|uniref:Acyl-protein thioesterase 1 n=1 Tax=Piloderma croceum (strain F 1598) TaxID=765440 RepID=A0A0C3BFE7_PILCF|nr:hypothetical protein PILCRDRAFT_798152 [Piloderma croceum F 1598]
MSAVTTDGLDFLTIPPPAKLHTATVIWIHGLGDTGRGMASFVRVLSRYYACNHIKWILPHAPTRWVTGCKIAMPSWFDLYSFDIPNRPEDETGLFNAVGQINDLINAEIESGIPPHRIVVGGLSQGAGLAVLTGLATERKLAGIFVLSGYIPLRGKAESICKPLFPSIPLFFAHGTADMQINYQFACDAAETFASQLRLPFHLSEPSLSKTPLLESDLIGLRFHSYQGMGHTISEMELEDLRLWIAAVLPKQGSSSMCAVF